MPVCNECGKTLTDEPRQKRGDYRCDGCVDAYQQEYTKKLQRLRWRDRDSSTTVGVEDGIVTK